jgi:hypothetical protein
LDKPLLAEAFPGQPALAYFEFAPVASDQTRQVVQDAVDLSKAGLKMDAGGGGGEDGVSGWITSRWKRAASSEVGCQVSGGEAGGRVEQKVAKDAKGPGLWAKIRWSDVGEEAVKGGRYRFISPVWNRADCVDLGGGRVRPVRLLNAAVTNDPNIKGMRPLRSQK